MSTLVGIDKRLTTHTARKTFASTVLLLFNEVPMEIVSELLGQSSITVAEESCGKVVRKNVSLAIEKLNKSLEPWASRLDFFNCKQTERAILSPFGCLVSN